MPQSSRWRLLHRLLGLIRAVELFDPSTGGNFGAFAEQQIKDAITRALG